MGLPAITEAASRSLHLQTGPVARAQGPSPLIQPWVVPREGSSTSDRRPAPRGNHKIGAAVNSAARRVTNCRLNALYSR